MADDSYNTQVVIEQGGKVLRIKGSGSITFDSGGTIDLTNATVTGGGAQQTIGNGQTLEIQSGATLQIDSGATLTMPNGTIVTAELNAGAVTGPKLDLSGLKCIAFVGHSGAGACTATGTAVGDRVVAIFGTATAGGALVSAKSSFESAITVINQIQQSSASDLSGNTYIALLLPAAA